MSIDSELPIEMREYTYHFGHPLGFVTSADRIVRDRTWMVLVFETGDVRRVLARAADASGAITLDCAFFAQLVVACHTSDNQSGEIRLGFGPYAVHALAKKHAFKPACVLRLPSHLYDLMKALNPLGSQYLVGPTQDLLYLGMADQPLLISLDEWKTYLRVTARKMAMECADEEARATQLRVLDSPDATWELTVFDDSVVERNRSLALTVAM